MTSEREQPYTVQKQPTQDDIHSNFKMFPGETLLFTSKMKTGCCNLGDVYFTSLTDTRYVARREQFVCCFCCCEKPYSESCIYLHDVAELREQRLTCCASNPFWNCICGPCSCLCCCWAPTKYFQLVGPFGTHMIHIYGKDVPHFETIIAEATAKQKVSNRY